MDFVHIMISCVSVWISTTTTTLVKRKRRQWRKEGADGDGVQHTKRSRAIQYAESSTKNTKRECTGERMVYIILLLC